MARELEDLVQWLGRENEFPHGAFLLTGTGIVPGNDFTLALVIELPSRFQGLARFPVRS